MSDLRKAAQQALEAMEYAGMDVGKFNRINSACAALRAALAQEQAAPEPACKCSLRTRLVGSGCAVCNPELAAELRQEKEQPAPEPVAWMNVLDGGYKCLAGKQIGGWTPLYTAPPQRPLLTEEEMCSIAERYGCRSADWIDFARDFARAIERAVRGEA